MATAAITVVCRHHCAMPQILCELASSSPPSAPMRIAKRSLRHARLAKRAPTKRATPQPRALHLIP